MYIGSTCCCINEINSSTNMINGVEQYRKGRREDRWTFLNYDTQSMSPQLSMLSSGPFQYFGGRSSEFPLKVKR